MNHLGLNRYFVVLNEQT